MVERLRGREAQVMRRRIMRRDRGLCQRCKRSHRLSLAHEVDHIVALINGGTNNPSNQEAICIPCHKEKSAEDLGHVPRLGCDANGMPHGIGHHWNANATA